MLQQAPPQELCIEGFSEAAVLVPVIRRRHGITLGYTLRHDEMPTHAGQISFPGGCRAPSDADLTATALREAAEELGLEPADVEVAGRIDDVPSTIGFVITPIVGWIDDPPEFPADPREVQLYFEVDLEELAAPANFVDAGEREIAGKRYPLPEYHVAGQRIWGATARITQRFLQIVGLA